MEQLAIPAAQLGGTVFTVVIFLRYLSTRDVKWERALVDGAKSNLQLAKALQRLADIVERNTDEGNKNTASIVKSKISSDKNTDAIDKNTEVISTTTNGNGKH